MSTELFNELKYLNTNEQYVNVLSKVKLSLIYDLVVNDIMRKQYLGTRIRVLNEIVKTKYFSLLNICDIICLSLKEKRYWFLCHLLKIDNPLIHFTIFQYQNKIGYIWLKAHQAGDYDINPFYGDMKEICNLTNLLSTVPKLYQNQLPHKEISRSIFENYLLSDKIKRKDMPEILAILRSGYLIDYAKYINLIVHQNHKNLLIKFIDTYHCKNSDECRRMLELISSKLTFIKNKYLRDVSKYHIQMRLTSLKK